MLALLLAASVYFVASPDETLSLRYEVTLTRIGGDLRPCWRTSRGAVESISTRLGGDAHEREVRLPTVGRGGAYLVRVRACDGEKCSHWVESKADLPRTASARTCAD